MTEIHIQPPPLALDPATRTILLQSIVDTLPHLPNASDADRAVQREAAFTLLGTLAPTDPVEAMLAAQIVASHYACINAYRWAARSDLPPALQLRYQAKAATFSRLTSSKRRELLRLQASQPALPAGFLAARAAQAQATVPAAPARPAAPAPQPKAAAVQRPATPTPAAAPGGRAAGLSDAAIDRLLATASAEPDTADDDDAPPTDAEFAQLVANAHALLAEIAPPAQDAGARHQARVAAGEASATKLAA